MKVHTLSSILIFILQSFHYIEVEARRGSVIPLGSYGSSERRHLKGAQINQHARESYEYEKAEFPEFRKRKTKKKHKVIKNENSLSQNSGAEDKQKLKHKRKRGSKRFIKTSFKDIDKDSNLSDSEDDKKNKPVDIIVHIKMKD